LLTFIVRAPPRNCAQHSRTGKMAVHPLQRRRCVEISAIAAAVTGRASSIDYGSAPTSLDGLPSLETRAGPNGTTIAVFTPSKPGRHTVSLSSGAGAKGDDVIIDC